jgi:hypothetical protein
MKAIHKTLKKTETGPTSSKNFTPAEKLKNPQSLANGITIFWSEALSRMNPARGNSI